MPSEVGLRGPGCSLQHTSSRAPQTHAEWPGAPAERIGLLPRNTQRQGRAPLGQAELYSPTRRSPPGPRPATSPARGHTHLLRGTPEGGLPRGSAGPAQNKGTKPWGAGGPAITEGRRAPFPSSPASSPAGRLVPACKVTSRSQGPGGCHGDTWTPG